jgi:hypothetical protein
MDMAWPGDTISSVLHNALFCHLHQILNNKTRARLLSLLYVGPVLHYTANFIVRLLLMLTKRRIKTAPAATSVEYQAVKFNVTTEANPFVGAGPKVDQAWREISYDGKQHGPVNSE